MSKSLKKIFAVVTSVTMAVMLLGPVAPAQAMTAEELQASITQLQVQLAQLTAQLAGLEGGGTTPPPSSGTVPAVCAGITFNVNLTLRASGNDVKCLQALLNTDSATQVASSGAGSPGQETTYFGNLTKAAVIKFQEKYASEVLAQWGLTAGTGYVGSSTRTKLNAMLTGGVTPCTSYCPAASTYCPGYEPSNGCGGTCPTGTKTADCGTVPPAGAGLTVALADDNPSAATIVADSGGTTESAQSMIPVLKVKLTNGGSSAVKVTQMKFKRAGISADADLSQLYLYEGDTLLADYSAYSSAIVTFSNSAGIISVPAGGSKVVTLKVDLTNNTSSGKTIRFSLEAATDVVSDASAVSGTFPLTGNYMSTAQAADVGQLTVGTSTSPSASVDPQDNFEVFGFTLLATDQKINVYKIRITNIGSTAYTDIANLKLYDGGVQIGSTVAQMAIDKTVTFDLTSSPLAIDKGITKNLKVRADLVGGTNRTFQFSIQNIYDIIAYDTQYGIYIKPDKVDSWTIHTAGNASTISTGKLTLSRSTDSPSGNIPSGGTNVTIAKFDIKATGEDVKITSMNVRLYGTINTWGLDNGKVYFDGAQKDVTRDLNSATAAGSAGDTAFSFGSNLIIPAGETKTLEIKGDIRSSTSTAFSGNETVTCNINTVVATGRASLATVSVGSPSGYQLTVKTGTLSAAANQSRPNWATTTPTGVPGATGVLVGSFVVTAGAAEGADISAIKIKDEATASVGFDDLQNVMVYKGTKDSGGVQLGNTQSSVSDNTTYTFYPSPYISLAANESFTLNVYGDILTSAGTTTGVGTGYVILDEVQGTGKVTNTAVDWGASTDANGPRLYVADAGTLSVALDTAGAPVAGLMVMGTTGNTFTKVKLTAGAGEAINVTQVVVTATLGSSAPTSTLQNVSLWEGTTQIGSSISSLAVDGTATFNLTANPWVVQAGKDQYLTIKSDINNYAYGQSGGTVALGLIASAVTAKGAMSGTAPSASSAVTGRTMTTYRTIPTVTYVGPSTGTLADGTQTLLRFKVKADSSADVNIRGFNFNVVLSDAATATNIYLKNITLYDEADMSTALNDTVATSTDGLAYTTSTVVLAQFGYETTSNSESGSLLIFSQTDSATSTMDVVPAGQEVTYALTATVTGSAQYDSVIARLADGASARANGILWGDQVTAEIVSTYVKTVPTNYGSLSR